MSKLHINSFQEFWPYYVREHSHPGCRALHFIGSTFVLVLLVSMFIFQKYWLFFLLPLVGYGFAWVGHFAIEKNRPATFKYPLWSLIGDWKMWWKMLTGRMQPEIERAMALPDRI
jgi:hypothetical protein